MWSAHGQDVCLQFDEEDFAEEQGMMARLVHLFKAPHPDEQYQVCFRSGLLGIKYMYLWGDIMKSLAIFLGHCLGVKIFSELVMV